MKILVIVILCLIVFIIADSIIDNKLIDITRYSFTDSRVDKNCKLVFLSDLHDNRHGKNNEKLLKLIEKEKPDVILVGGDMITAKPGCSYVEAVKLMKELCSLKVPVIYAMGNHEYRMMIYTDDYGDSYERFMGELKGFGVKPLCNDNVMLEEFNVDVQGLMLERETYKRWGGRVIPGRSDVHELISSGNIGQAAAEAQEDSQAFKILLAHNPEYFNAYEEEADLILSGHFHGGIARIPGIGGVISPRLTLFPKYSGGKYEAKIDGRLTTMIVSRGLGSHTIPVRVFNRVELPVIELKSGKE